MCAGDGRPNTEGQLRCEDLRQANELLVDALLSQPAANTLWLESIVVGLALQYLPDQWEFDTSARLNGQPKSEPKGPIWKQLIRYDAEIVAQLVEEMSWGALLAETPQGRHLVASSVFLLGVLEEYVLKTMSKYSYIYPRGGRIPSAAEDLCQPVEYAQKCEHEVTVEGMHLTYLTSTSTLAKILVSILMFSSDGADTNGDDWREFLAKLLDSHTGSHKEDSEGKSAAKVDAAGGGPVGNECCCCHSSIGGCPSGAEFMWGEDGLTERPKPSSQLCTHSLCHGQWVDQPAAATGCSSQPQSPADVRRDRRLALVVELCVLVLMLPSYVQIVSTARGCMNEADQIFSSSRTVQMSSYSLSHDAQTILGYCVELVESSPSILSYLNPTVSALFHMLVRQARVPLTSRF